MKNFFTSLSISIFLIGAFACTKTSSAPSSAVTTTTSGGTTSGGTTSGGTTSGGTTSGGTTSGGTTNNNVGGISGTVSPVNVICKIEAVDALSGLTKATTTSNGTDGSFSFSNLPPAKYNVRATPTPDPNNLGVHTWIGAIVSAGATATVGPISF